MTLIEWERREGREGGKEEGMKERERKVYKVKEGIEEGSFKRDSQESLGRKVWILETALFFLRNASTKDFVPKGLKYAHYWINGQFVHSDLLLLKRTVCSPLTSAEASPREQGRKPASPNEVSYHRFLSQRHLEFPTLENGFHSLRLENSVLASWKLPREGVTAISESSKELVNK